MVIKGNARGGAASLAAHLQRTDTNEVAELRQLRGVAAEDLDGALREMEAVAAGARSGRHFYHASINTRADEVLTAEQWLQAVDRLEHELDLTGQPRAVVAHVKEGREHLHVAWSRIDIETLRAIPDGHNYRRHEIVARELEREFGHARVQGAHVEREGERPARTPSHAEMQQAERSGIAPAAAKAELTEIWRRTDSGKAFGAAIEQQGWTLARGDKRDFVAVDQAGEAHSLARRIEGAKAKDIRARMADLDPADLPGVEEAKEIQRARGQARADACIVPRPEPASPPASEHVTAAEPPAEAGQGAMSDSQTTDAARLAQEEADRQARDRQADAQRQNTARPAEGPSIEDLARANADRQVQQIEDMREQRARLDRFEADHKRQAEEARQEAEQKRSDEARDRQAEYDIRDAGDRYRIALGQHYEMRDPYGSLSRAAMAEYGAFIQDREQLTAQIAAEPNAEARRALELRRDIESADYMAITSQRIAAQSEIISGRRDSDEAQLFRERAAGYETQSKELRQQYRDHAAERAAREPPGGNSQAAPQPDSSDKAEAREQDYAAAKGEISDAKAERINRIREQGRAFESTEKERQNSQAQSRDQGGRSR